MIKILYIFLISLMNPTDYRIVFCLKNCLYYYLFIFIMADLMAKEIYKDKIPLNKSKRLHIIFGTLSFVAILISGFVQV